MRVFETRTATGREHFACQDSGVSQIFILIISNGGNILINIKVVVNRQVTMENSSLPFAVRISKTCMIKLPNGGGEGPGVYEITGELITIQEREVSSSILQPVVAWTSLH